jgi:hypothetical protein
VSPSAYRHHDPSAPPGPAPVMMRTASPAPAMWA